MSNDANSATGATGPDPEGPTPTQSPEDVVRRLLQAEGSGNTPPRPETIRAAHTVKPSGTAAPVLSPGRRLFAAPKRAIAAAWTRARDAVLAYRPTPRHIAVLLLVVVVLTWPWLIPLLVLLALTILVICYLTLGHDRASELVATGYGWAERRDPEGAEALRQGAADVSARLSIWVGYLPDRWTNGLYLPDFEQPGETPEALLGDPFDRLAEDAQNR